jgi:hypothetical protein
VGVTWRRWGLGRAAAGAGAVCVLAATAAGAQSVAGGPEALRGVPGSGTFTFAGKSNLGFVKGTVTTTVVPASITPGQPYRATMKLSWTETIQAPNHCNPGTIPGQTHPNYGAFPLVSPVRPGHGEDLLNHPQIVDAAGNVTNVWGDNVTTCGAIDTVRQTDSYEALVSGSLTKSYTPSCVAPYPSAGTDIVGSLGPDGTYDGTFAVLTIGGAECTSAAAPAGGTTTTDTFTAAGQVKPHAVAVPANRTRAEITLRWTKPTDRFTVAGVALTPKRRTSSVSRADKLKITFFARTGTSLGVRIENLAPGRLTYRIVATKVSGKATVRTKTVLKS